MPRRWTGPEGPEIALPRGDVTEGVVRIGATVRRPHAPGGDVVAAYLDHLARVGFRHAPRYLGRDHRGRDVLDFLAGDVPGARLPGWAASELALTSVADLLRRLHTAGAAFRPAPGQVFPRDRTGAPGARLPGGPRLVSHGDVTPQNVVFRDGAAWGLVDFDLSGWTTALTDLAGTAMYWVPLQDAVDRDPVLRDVDVAARLALFLTAYGLPPQRWEALLDAAALRFAGLGPTMRWRAEHLGGGWARMWDEGVGGVIARRVAWFDRERPRLLAARSAEGRRRAPTAAQWSGDVGDA